MIRLDMSEYQQVDSINRLIGSPDGKYDGILSQKIRSHPFSLILIDEIEKAHPNILMTFLQVLDEGHLTDSSGMTLDFTSSIIIATSNVGTREIQDNPDDKEKALSAVRKHFAPELLNRFSGIVVFNPLSKENLKQITKLLLEKTKQNAQDSGIKVLFKPELIEKLAEGGYSKEWGARPLARLIEDTVNVYLADQLLK